MSQRFLWHGLTGRRLEGGGGRHLILAMLEGLA